MARSGVIKNCVLGSVVGIAFVLSAQAETPDTEEMWKIIQQQQKIIEQLQQKLEQTDQKVEVAEKKVEEATQEVEAAAEAIEVASTSSSGSGWWEKTSLGGYGELHYSSRDGDDQVDFHRYVLYVGHEFTDDVRFFSEWELEHSLAGEGKEGEVELEQAWIEMDINDSHSFRAGLDILPIGIINTTHEPNTFYGVERNRVESEVIPATWWEAGAGVLGELAPGWNYHVVLHSGLSVPTASGRIRSGRNKVAEANADHPAFTGNLRYTGIPGLEVGGTIQYQDDIVAGAQTSKNSATLFEGHIDYKHSSGFGLRALYAGWDLDNVIEAGTEDDNQDGYYIEPSYRFGIAKGDVGIFGRYQQLDLANDREEESYVAGIQWWPVDQVVFKMDYETREDEDANTDQDIYSLGLGFSF
jgi:phosphate-selective porin O/P